MTPPLSENGHPTGKMSANRNGYSTEMSIHVPGEFS